MHVKTSEDLIELGGSHHMAVSCAAAEKLAVAVCSQTICSSGVGLVSQLEDFLMEVSLQGAMPQNAHGRTSLASKAPEEKAWPVLQPPPSAPSLGKLHIASNHLNIFPSLPAVLLLPCCYRASKGPKRRAFFFFFNTCT